MYTATNEDSDNEENSTKKKKTVEEEHEKQKSDDTLHKKVSKGHCTFSSMVSSLDFSSVLVFSSLDFS
jgi:hypothetical protein